MFPHESPSTVSQRPRARFARFLILVLGVLAIPFALTIALSSYGELTAAGAVRMAFGAVAGQTVSVLAGLGALVITVRIRESVPRVLLYVVIEVIVVVFAVDQAVLASDLLLTRLSGLS